MGIDILAIQPSVIPRNLSGKYILLSGEPKIGKTEFCTTAKDSLVLAFELGTNARPGAMVQPIEKWTDVRLVLRQLENQAAKEKFKVICWDTVGIAWDLCEQYICAQAGVSKIGDIPYGAGYKSLSQEFERVLRRITMLGYGIILTSHLKEEVNKEGVVVGYKPDLNGRCLKVVNGLVDIIGVITKEWDDKEHKWTRSLITRSTPTISAGSRYQYLDPVIPFGYSYLEEAVARAIDKEIEINGGVAVDKAPINTEEALDFEVVRNRSYELWTQLVGEGDNINEDMARRIQKKIEMIFGRPMKLSEATDNQVDLLNLVNLEMEDML